MSLEFLTVSGGSDAIKEHFSLTYGWDGDSPRALLSHRLGHEGIIQATNWLLLGSLRPIVVPTANIWSGTAPSLRITIDIKDLAVFEFPGNSNISHWIDASSLRVTYAEKVGSAKVSLDEVSAQAKGVGTFAVRAHIIPITDKAANFWVTVTPFSVSTIREKAGLANLNSPQIPTISLPIATLEPEGNPTKSLQAELGIREPTTLNLGIGALALMDTTAAPNTPLPSLNDYKEATVGTYRSVSSVRTATSKSVIQRMEEFLSGKVTKLRQPLEIFPVFVNPVRPTGQSFFFITTVHYVK